MSPPPARSPALDRKSHAHAVVTAELLAALTQTPLDLARRFHREWFGTLHFVGTNRLVAVLGRVVVGPPEPLTLEAADHLRVLRRAERSGMFDELADPDDVPHEVAADPPDIPALTVAVMQRYQDGERLLDRVAVIRALTRILDPPVADLAHLVVLESAGERLLADVADLVRIGPGMVVDARTQDERVEDARSWSWAA